MYSIYNVTVHFLYSLTEAPWCSLKQTSHSTEQIDTWENPSVLTQNTLQANCSFSLVSCLHMCVCVCVVHKVDTTGRRESNSIRHVSVWSYKSNPSQPTVYCFQMLYKDAFYFVKSICYIHLTEGILLIPFFGASLQKRPTLNTFQEPLDRFSIN